MLQSRPPNAHQGFSLIELVWIMAVIGAIVGSVWIYAGSASKASRLEQAAETDSLLVDATRNAYGGGSSISGDVSTVVPNLIAIGALPSHLMRTTASKCVGTSSNYMDTPWVSTYDVCGTLRVCAWTYRTNTTCAKPAVSGAAQFFALEFTALDYGTCLSLAGRISSAVPPGLKDVYINGTSVLALLGNLSVAPTTAAAQCTMAVTTNVIDFVYTLRAPTS